MIGSHGYQKIHLHFDWSRRAIEAGGDKQCRETLLTLYWLVHCRVVRGSNPFRVSYDEGELFALKDRRTLKSHMRRLEEWGLIEIEWFPHAAPRVKLMGDTRKPPQPLLRVVSGKRREA
jgi:hypothetical protein